MRLIYTDHLRDRMAERGITDAEIRYVLRVATTSYGTPRASTCIVGSTASGRVLKIWVKGAVTLPLEEGMKLIIKSVAGRDEVDA